MKIRLALLFLLFVASPSWAAVAHRASAVQAGTTSTTTDTITIPASIATDDDCYVFVTSRDHISTDLFVTVVDDDITGNLWAKLGNSTDRKSQFFWKKATAATASKTITIALAQGSLASGLSCFSGAAAGDPTTDIVIENNTSGSEVHAAFTPTNADSMVVFNIANSANDNSVTVAAAATLGSFEPELYQILNTGGSDCASWTSAVLSAGGPTDTGGFTWTQTGAVTRTLTFAIKPPAAAPGTSSGLLPLMGVGN